MSAIKDGRFPIMLDKKRYLLFSLNVLDELQDKAGGYDKLNVFLSGKVLFKNLKWLLTILLNEGADENDEKLTEIQVGKLIHTGNLRSVQETVFKAFSIGSCGSEQQSDMDEELTDCGEDDEKNIPSGQE